MSDLRVRFGFILALALFPILLFSFYMAYAQGRFALVIVSTLAWVFAYFAIWIATDKLIFSYLRTIKSASDKFSLGDMTTRVGPMHGAPTRITELGLAFDQMAENISVREEQILDNLHEKETLLGEIHHRVKNNLQIIISLLNMQERKLKDKAGIEAIKDTRSRINAISLVHRGLYEGEDLRIVDMPMFLSRLVNELKIGLGADVKSIKIEANIVPLKLPPDTAIPVAFFIVEALTNAIKHGKSLDSEVMITLSVKEENIRVSITNNSDEQFVINGQNTGTGTKLMQGFARQLSGEILIHQNKSSYNVELLFKFED